MKRVLETDYMGEAEIMESYDSLRTLDLVNEYFLERASELCSAGKVLDVGCGTGKMLRSMPACYQRYGIDIDQRIIDFARQKGGGVNYEVGDSNNLPYGDNSFDLVMCHSVLHHLKDPRQTVEEILRVVKPDGAVFIRDLCRPATEEVLQRYFIGFLAAHYDEQNKRLFEISLRSSLTFAEWKSLFPEDTRTSKVFFYNIAERAAEGVRLNDIERRLKELEFVQRRSLDSIVYES
jgi:ubiquinone/menaquinone biosynthesis C-methylase UbiE